MRKVIGFGVGFGGGSGALPFDPLHLTAHAGWPTTILEFVGYRQKQKRKKRVMIIYSNTGGGHKASAEALKSGFYQMYKDRYEVELVDLWRDHSPFWMSHMMNLYSFLVKHPVLYWGLYHTSNPVWMHRPGMYFFTLLCYSQVNEAFEVYKPDLVVSVHPLWQSIPLKVLNDRIRSGEQHPIAFATVITDYTTCHNSWFNRGTTQCFVPTQQCYDQGRRLGLRDDQLVLHGLPIRPEFGKPFPSKISLQKKLHMLPDVPAALLVGGGEGMGQLEKIVAAIEREIGPQCQLVVICGRNKALAKRLSNRKFPEGMNVIVRGFVNNMNEWMYACDAIVTKAGPGTIAEAMICGTPILLNGYIPGQEVGNVSYVTENQVGDYERNPRKIAAVLKRWFLSESEELKEMSSRAKSLGRPDALMHIVQDLAALCEQSIFNPSFGKQSQPVLA